MHPRIPMVRSLPVLFSWRSFDMRPQIFDSAFSRMAQVFRNTMSASSLLGASLYPASTKIRATT